MSRWEKVLFENIPNYFVFIQFLEKPFDNQKCNSLSATNGIEMFNLKKIDCLFKSNLQLELKISNAVN